MRFWVSKVWVRSVCSVVAVGALAGCSEGADTAGGVELEKAAVSAVRAQYYREATVDCGGAQLPVEVGASVQCELRVSGEDQVRSADVQVSSVSGDGYTVDVVVSPEFEAEVSPVGAEDLSAVVGDEVRDQVKADPQVSCADDMAREVGAEGSCSAQFVGEEKPRSVKVSVGSVEDDGRVGVDVVLVPSVGDEPLSDSRGSVASVVADALAGQLGAKPSVDCGDGFVPLVDGGRLVCSVSSVEGELLGDAEVVLGGVSGGSYEVDVQLPQDNGHEN